MTGIKSQINVEVDGVCRHVLDVRRVYDSEDENSDASESDNEEASGEKEEQRLDLSADEDQVEDISNSVPRRSNRLRRLPVKLQDYVM